MPIDPRSFNEIVTSLRTRFTSTAPQLDTKEGTFSRIALIDPTAIELTQLETLLLEVQESQSLLTAKGVDLDLLAFNYNVHRRAAQKASGFVQVFIDKTLLIDPIVVEKGSIITSDTGIEYETLLEGVLNGFAQETLRGGVEVYQITLPVASTITGSAGNANPGTLNLISISNISVTNDAAIVGGYEAEPDDSLATRSILSFGVWSRGVKQAVEFGARLIPGVYYAKAVTDYAGHFKIFVSDQAGNLSDEMRQAVFDILVDWAGTGNGWTVVQPPLELIDVTVKVIFKTTVNMAQLIDKLQSDVATIINKSNTSEIYLDDLISEIKIATSGYVLHFDIDVPNEHILFPDGTIIRSGNITVINQTT